MIELLTRPGSLRGGFLCSALILCCSSFALAQEEATPDAAQPPPEERTIFVPYENLQQLLQDQAARALVPYQDYLEFLRHTGRKAIEHLPVKAAITRAEYDARVEEDLVRITAKYTIQTLGEPWVELPLAFGDAAVGQIEGGGEKTLLRGTGEGTYALLLGEKGEQTITLELVSRIRTTPDGREFSLTVPPVAISNFKLTVPETEQTIEVTPRQLSTTSDEPPEGTTVVEASLGATASITARWRPRASAQPEMDLLASVTNHQLTTVEGELIHRDAWLTWEVLRGELTTLQVAAPLGSRILDVSADARLKSWQAKEEETRQVITLEFLSPIEKRVTVEVHAEQPLDGMSFQVAGVAADGTVHGIHAVDAVRESGQAAVRVGEDLELTVAEQQGVARAAASELDDRLKPGAAHAWRFYSPQFQLAAAVRPVEPRVQATQHVQIVFDEQELRLESTLRWQVERVGVFDVTVRIPDGVVIDDVQSPQMQDETFNEESRLLTVRLQQKTQGQIDLTLRGHQPLEDVASLDLPIPEPQNVMRETGTLHVFAPPSIELATDDDGVEAAQPVAAPPGVSQGRAVLTSAWSYSRRPVRIPVAISRKPTRLSADIATTIDVQPETVEVTTLLEYRVEFAGVDTFEFLVPASAGEGVQIEADAAHPESAAVKQRTAGEAADGWIPWTVVTQREVTGVQRFRITYRMVSDAAPPAAGGAPPADPAAAGGAAAPAAGGNDLSVQLIRPRGKPADAEGEGAVPLTRLKGEVRVLKERSLAVTAEAEGGDVEPIDIRELTLLPQEGATAFRYYRQPDEDGVTVSLSRTKHDIQEVVPTVVQRGLVEIATERQTAATYRARYLIRTVERQQLRIDLPEHVELLGSFIDGVDERLIRLEAPEEAPQPGFEPYAINISRRGSSDEPFVVTLQYNWHVNPPPFEGVFGRGAMTLPLPQVGGSAAPAQVQELEAVVYVPEKFWLVGRPDRFSIPGEQGWWSGLFGSPAPHQSRSADGQLQAHKTPLDFPTEGLVGTKYLNLGGAPQIEVIWWDSVKMTLLLSIAVAVFAFILLRTGWENKLGILLLLAFLALLFGVRDSDALAHGLAAARYGLLFLVALWILHALFQSGRSASHPPPTTEPPPAAEGAAAT